PEMSSLWRSSYLPKIDEYFNCRVVHIEKEGVVFVVDDANIERRRMMVHTITDAEISDKLMLAENIHINTLVLLKLNSKLYRGRVVSVNQKTQKAEIKLVDVGSMHLASFEDIYAALPSLAEYQAFALQVKLPNKRPVMVNKKLRLRLLDALPFDGVYNVGMKGKTIPLNLPMEIMLSHPGIRILRFFVNDNDRTEPSAAIIQIKELSNINGDLNYILTNIARYSYNLPFPEEKAPFFVAARTKYGFRRAFLLDHIDEPTPTYIVYEMDEGRVSICTELTRIPDQLLDIPMRAMSLTLKNSALKPLSLDTRNENLTLSFKADTMKSRDTFKMSNATLLSNGETVCLVRLSLFLGQPSEIGHKFWRDPIKKGDAVFITRVVAADEIYISSIETHQYGRFFKHLEQRCKPFKLTSGIPMGCIVLVVCPELGNFRGEVSAMNGDLYTVANIDTGAVHQIPFEMLRMSCRFLETMPVSLVRVKLQKICQLSPADISGATDAVALLREYSKDKEIFILDAEDTDTSVDLLLRDYEDQSLVSVLLSNIVTTDKGAGSETPRLPLSSPDLTDESIIPTYPCESLTSLVLEPTYDDVKKLMVDKAESLPSLPETLGSAESLPRIPSVQSGIPESFKSGGGEMKQYERFYLQDLRRCVIPIGDDIEVIVLCAQNVAELGYITACHFANENVGDNFETLLALVAHHGSCSDMKPLSYIPGVKELCLARYSEDNGWYRATCEEINGKFLKIQFLDFGNIETVHLDDLKPIPNDVLHPIYATKCIIEGFNKKEDFKVLEEYLRSHMKLSCKFKESNEPNARIIVIPNLKDILAKKVT
ncbi:hypothetical protein KR018_010685, partial [Drosophila ironensis]